MNYAAVHSGTARDYAIVSQVYNMINPMYQKRQCSQCRLLLTIKTYLLISDLPPPRSVTRPDPKADGV